MLPKNETQRTAKGATQMYILCGKKRISINNSKGKF